MAGERGRGHGRKVLGGERRGKEMTDKKEREEKGRMIEREEWLETEGEGKKGRMGEGTMVWKKYPT